VYYSPEGGDSKLLRNDVIIQKTTTRNAMSLQTFYHVVVVYPRVASGGTLNEKSV